MIMSFDIPGEEENPTKLHKALNTIEMSLRSQGVRIETSMFSEDPEGRVAAIMTDFYEEAANADS